MLEVKGVGKTFATGSGDIVALKGIDLEVSRGEFVTILGPSGCGKSTLLHLLGGFDDPTEGSITLDGRPINGPGRDRGMVFQHATLFPWRTVIANVAWPIEVTGVDRRAARARAAELLELVGLSGFGGSLPGELSGGMRQRAAIARTLAMNPSVLLMDEPFGALDAQTRELMQEELNRLWQQAELTVVFITHDINEAIFLGDRVITMSSRPGRIVDDCPIEIPRPRGVEAKHDPHVLEYHNRFWGLIRDQLVPARAATAKSGIST
ncbi:MAG: ABC transporter ATP-binding protein [Pseudonocardiaceae bacterium]